MGLNLTFTHSEPPTYGAEPHLDLFRDPQPMGLSPTSTHSEPPTYGAEPHSDPL